MHHIILILWSNFETILQLKLEIQSYVIKSFFQNVKIAQNSNYMILITSKENLHELCSKLNGDLSNLIIS